MAQFHGCHGYHGNGCHGYKNNIELVSKQTFVLIHSYHQVHCFYSYNWSKVSILYGIYAGKIPISEYTMNYINYLRCRWPFWHVLIWVALILYQGHMTDLVSKQHDSREIWNGTFVSVIFILFVTSCICLVFHLLYWASGGGATNSSSHVLHMGVSYSR